MLETAELQALLDRLLGYEVRFCREYIADFDADKALKRANVHGATSTKARTALATKLLAKDDIKAYLVHLQAERGIRTKTTPDRVLRELEKIAFQDVRDYITMEDGTVRFRDFDEMANTASISSFELASMAGDFREMGVIHKLKSYDKLKALELLAKHYAMFTEAIDITTKGEKLDDAPKVYTKVVINHRRKGERLG